MSKQRGVFRRSQASAAGYDRREFERLVRMGAWIKLRHGIYTTSERYDAAALDPISAHLLAAAARRLAMGGDTVVSHGSAAFAAGMSLLDPVPAEPTLTLHRPTGRGRLTAHDVYVASVPQAHRLQTSPMTTPARSVADCARTLPREAAFVTVESALHLGLDRLELIRVLRACAGWPGAAEAGDLIMIANPWSESPLESLARLWFLAQGLPQPMQQRTILRLDGRFVARVDFLWPQYRTVCEVDGRLKYDGSGDALWREKLREDDLRDVGLEVARGTWRDRRDNGAALAGKLRRAFARGLAGTEAPRYVVRAPRPITTSRLPTDVWPLPGSTAKRPSVA